MGYLIRPYEFSGAPPSLENLVAAAQQKGALPISFDGGGPRANVAFECHSPGIIGLERTDKTIWISGQSANTSVLIDLLDLCLREAGGTTRLDFSDCAMPLPLTQAYVASEARRVERFALTVMLSLLAFVLLVIAGFCVLGWLIIRLVSNLF